VTGCERNKRDREGRHQADDEQDPLHFGVLPRDVLGGCNTTSFGRLVLVPR